MLRIAALIAVHNGAATLPSVLQHLARNSIDAYVLDHGSTDRTGKIIETYRGYPVVGLETAPFDGVFRLTEQMAWKLTVWDRLDADWVVHLDADEIDESPHDGETLRRFIERMDEQGHDVIDCDEFVFVPTDLDEDHSAENFLRSMRRYYYFAPPNRSLHRIVRRTSGTPEWGATAGHQVNLTNRRLAPERVRKRHYIGLSKAHLEAQYLGRVYAAAELEVGNHSNRLATTEDFIQLPVTERTFHLDRDGWRTDRPETVHPIFNQRIPFSVPDRVLPLCCERPPMPFIIGVGRSGTTLLRLMLDAHPQLVISPETSWLGALIRQLEVDAQDIAQVKTVLTTAPNWADMGISEIQLDDLLREAGGADFIRGLYRLYARRTPAKASVRVGDKTPHNSLVMTRIARMLPEAHFVHIIRDGRDVAVSHRGLWFGPGSDAEAAARFWMWRIRDARQQAQFLPHYLEVRYEELVANPEIVLRQIGDFIELPFDPVQLSYTESAAARLAELGDVRWPSLVVTARMRRGVFERTLVPPDPTRIARWRREMTAQDVRAFERVAGDFLSDLGYPVGEA